MDPRRLIARTKVRLEVLRARHGALDIGVTTFKRFSVDDGGAHSAALTYYFFFSIFPLLLFGSAILGYLTQGDTELRERVLTETVDAIPMLSDVLTEENLATIEERRQQIALTGLVLALYAGSGAVVALSHALNRIHGVEEERNFVSKRLRSLGWLAAGGLAVALSLGLGAVAGYAARLFDSTAAVVLGAVLGHGVGFLVGVLVFGSAFRYLPEHNLTWAQILPGATLAAFLFEVLKVVGTWYLERGAQNREATFGTLAAAAGMLVASYLIAQVTLLCAELNDVLAERRLTRTSDREASRT